MIKEQLYTSSEVTKQIGLIVIKLLNIYFQNMVGSIPSVGECVCMDVANKQAKTSVVV